MPKPKTEFLAKLHKYLQSALGEPAILAFVPGLTLAAYWTGGELALLMVALGLPLLFAFAHVLGRGSSSFQAPKDSVTGLLLRDGFERVLGQVYEDTETSGLKSACFVLELDDCSELAERYGQNAVDLVVQRCGDRIISTYRDGDTVARLGDSRFAICLMAVRQLDLELCIQLAGRLQSAVEEPISLDGISIYVTCSIGFCLRSRTPGTNSIDWMAATQDALADAKQAGPSSIRAYSAEIRRKTKTRLDLRNDATAALENGQIQPWYQPQISTDTGKVSGFEVLARWNHPAHGMISPDEFLPVIEQAGLLERLGQVMLYHALTALKAWDSAGTIVPCVGVNFASDELRNPALVDKIRWELDRFDLSPDRLCVEVLESVVTDGPDETITRNIVGLGELGCRVDLDDFGTGHASIASIRRLSISRIKIDRSFVMKADRDPEQQQLVGAILTMAERLGIETLAEGVETVGEHTLLAQLGCDYVQGFGIGRPMPFDQTLDWIVVHEGKIQQAPTIKRETG